MNRHPHAGLAALGLLVLLLVLAYAFALGGRAS